MLSTHQYALKVWRRIFNVCCAPFACLLRCHRVFIQQPAPLALAPCLLPTQRPCEHLCEHSSFTTTCFQAVSLLTSSSTVYLPLWLPRRDICCCVHGTLARSQRPASSLPGNLLDNSGTSECRPIGALVCKPHDSRAAQLSNLAPFLFVISVLAVLKLHYGLERSVTAMSSGVTETTASGVDLVSLILRYGWRPHSQASCTNTCRFPWCQRQIWG